VPAPLNVAQVTPYAWEDDHELNYGVRALSDQLARRGHAVLVLAPSRSTGRARAGRRELRVARDGGSLLEPGSVNLLAVGEILEVPGRRLAGRSLPLDVARTVEEVLTREPFDIVHVHEPWAPSVASAALRHSRALNVGSFHAPTERLLSTQLGRRVVELVFGRLDARTTSFEITRELMRRAFPADYSVVAPVAPVLPADRRSGREAPHLAFVLEEERAALRLFLRALRALPLEPAWSASIHAPDGRAPLGALRRELRERVRIVAAADGVDAYAAADVVVAASLGTAPAPGVLLRALGAAAVPVAARLPLYEEILCDGELGLLFEPGDAETLAAQLARLISEPSLRSGLARAGAPARKRLAATRAADEFERIYATLIARRHDERGDAGLRRRVSRRRLIDVDLHMHTDHSHDCATPVQTLLDTAAERGLGAIAVTDHNEISGALDARERAGAGPVKVIVGEEVKTADQGEVIGLFIERKIPRGLTLEQTIAEIRAQGGLVYVPHPFDRLHAVPDYEHLLSVIDQVDVIEVFNPRVALQAFNEEAVRFAAKYRIVCGAGSDAHVTQGLGSVRIRMRDFEGAAEFLESLREADIIRRPTSLLYVQAIKFLQTRATPRGAREARRAARERRATRGAARKR
jgi:glycosyltransferase involved in cell wall biosynthesis